MTDRWMILNDINDIPKLMKFDTYCFVENDRLNHNEYFNWIIRGLKIYVLVNDITQDWIGSYQIVPEFREANYFAGFAVHPKYRRCGYGQKILNNIIENFNIDKDLACKTRRQNFPMIHLLKKNGFVNRLVDITTKDKWSWWIREL